MPALAQFLLKRRKALSKVSFSFTITFDIVSHLTSLQLYIVHDAGEMYLIFALEEEAPENGYTFRVGEPGKSQEEHIYHDLPLD